MSPEATSIEARFAAFSVRHRGLRLAASASATPAALVVKVDGDLDTQSSADFQATVLEVFGSAKELGGLILDLAALKYISSTGVGALTTLLVETRRHHIPLFLCRVTEQVGSILEVLGFTSFFPVVESYTESP